MLACSSFAAARVSRWKRSTMPAVQATSGLRTFTASRRSKSLSHTSYTSAKPPDPTRRFTSYLAPRALLRLAKVSGIGGYYGAPRTRAQRGTKRNHFRPYLAQCDVSHRFRPRESPTLYPGKVPLCSPNSERFLVRNDSMKATRLVVVALCLSLALACGDHTPTAPATPAPQADLIGSLLGATGLLKCSALPYASDTETIGPLGGVLVAGPHSLVI